MNLIYILLLIVGLATMFLYEAPAMIKQKHWRDLVVFCVLSLSVFTVSLLMLLDVDVPSPVRAIEAVVNGFLKIVRR